MWDSIEPITHAEMLKMSAPSASVASAELGGDKVVGATLTIHSPDGDQGFPCALDATARYYFDADDAFVIVLSATNRGARPTVCSMTNHAYWNLAGYAEQPRVAAALPAPDDSAPPSVMDHLMHAPNATFYLPADAFAIPTGEVLSTRGTALDFATAARLLHAGADDAMLDPGLPSKAGFDHCLVLAGGPPGVDRHAATLTDPASGRSMEVATTLPAVQIYSGNYLPRCVGHGGAVFGYRSAVCLETQLFPDSPNRGHFPTSTLRAGETFCHTTRHRFKPSTSRTQ